MVMPIPNILKNNNVDDLSIKDNLSNYVYTWPLTLLTLSKGNFVVRIL